VLSLHHIHCLGGAHAQAETTGRAQILAMTRRWSARVWPRGSAAKKLGLTQVPVMGRRAERVPVPAYRRMDALPACRMSRGHAGVELLCSKGASPLGAAEGPTPPAVAHRHPTNPTMPALLLPDRRAPI